MFEMVQNLLRSCSIPTRLLCTVKPKKPPQCDVHIHIDRSFDARNETMITRR